MSVPDPIGDIALEAGVSRPLVYRAFKDKETLLATWAQWAERAPKLASRASQLW